MNSQLDSKFIKNLLQTSLESYQKVLVNQSINITKDNQVINNNPFLFNNDLELKLPITDQKSSGRCWIFAALNMIRATSLKTLGDINDLEFSQTYLYFWDKFERYHRNLRYYLDIMTIDDEFKRNQYLLKLNDEPLGDGGQWSMVADLIKKYGIVPKKVMPDSFHSKASASMNNFLTIQLKQDFVTLSKGSLETYEMLINGMMTRIYNYLVGFLGKPPTGFDWTYKTKNGVDTMSLTPLSLLEKTQFKVDDWISIVNDPRTENPYFQKYQIKYLGNVSAQHITWLNLPIERLVTMTQESIENNCPVFFGCDVSAEYDRETGIHDVGLYDTKTFMNHSITMTKEEKLRYFASVPSHAMVIVGFHKDNNNEIQRWKIENSWGSSSGTSGFQLMTQKWFDRYVFQIVVHKYRLTVQELEIYNSDKIKVVEPWDPLGTLA